MTSYFNAAGRQLVCVSLSVASTAMAVSYVQAASSGLTPPSNTNSAYQDASIVRDSEFSQPLDLLNEFHPAIDVTITDHDNVRRRPDLDESDLKIVARPSLAYRTNIGRQQFYAAYTGKFTFHDDLEQEDADANNVFAKAGLDLTRRWDLDLFVAAGESFEERGISGGREFGLFERNGADSGPEEVEYVTYGADLIFGKKIAIVKGVLGFEHSETSFDSSDLVFGRDASERDRERDSLHLDLSWNFASRTSVFGRIQETEVDYDSRDNTLDSEQTDYLLGLRWKPTARLSGVVGLGRSDKDFDDGDREGYDGDTYYANLSYRVSPFSIIDLGASRIIEEPADERSSFYQSEYFGVGWAHALTPRVSLNAYTKWIDDDFDIEREDKFVDWGVGLDYAWRSWLTVGVYYGEVERDSTKTVVDYEDQYFGIRLTSDLRNVFRSDRKDQIEPAVFDYPQKSQQRTQRSQ